MKKIYFLAFILSGFFSYGQLSENFDADAALPAGWTTFIGANGIGSAQNWTTATARSFSPTRSAFVRYEDVNGGLAEDWLITPLVDLTNYTESTLTFYGGQQYTPEYGTEYTIRVSTTLPTGHSNFEIVESYFESDFSTIATPALQPGDLKTVDLSIYDGQQIYIAFVMTQDDGDNWFIDNVNVTGTLSTPSFDNAIISFYPNPTNNILNVNSTASIATIEIYGILGNLVKTVANSNQIDLTELANGSYVAKVTSTDGRVKTEKVIKI
ncbi:choice-of-anchor J domain-containing protein [Flavobacterium sp.]|uniref:T9SS type A sorting domain-containing protein n=1 Tax=Flavobacterium sp. TaxID=239 RepID=UPI00391D97C6